MIKLTWGGLAGAREGEARHGPRSRAPLCRSTQTSLMRDCAHIAALRSDLVCYVYSRWSRNHTSSVDILLRPVNVRAFVIRTVIVPTEPGTVNCTLYPHRKLRELGRPGRRAQRLSALRWTGSPESTPYPSSWAWQPLPLRRQRALGRPQLLPVTVVCMVCIHPYGLQALVFCRL